MTQIRLLGGDAPILAFPREREKGHFDCGEAVPSTGSELAVGRPVGAGF